MLNNINWLKIALAAEQQANNGQPNQPTQPTQPGQPNQLAEGEAPISPAPTPTTEQNVAAGKQQRQEFSKVREISVPDAARAALPTLNQSLYYLTNELMSREDLQLPTPAARALAIEIMAEWLAASRKGVVSDLASIVMSSPRISAVLGNIQ